MPIPDRKEVGTLYYEYGEDKNKHVLFIHGLGSSSIAWRDIPQALSEHFHTITVDLIGFGGSDKPNTADYTIKGFSKFIVDFLRERIGIKEKEKKNLIEKLVLIDSSGMLKEPTPLLKDYRVAAMQEDPVSRYEKVKRVFEDLYARPSRLLPVLVDLFNYTIEKPGAKHAFESAFDNSTTTQLGSERLKQIEDIPCLIIWGEKDKLIPIEYASMFTENLQRAKFEKIEDAGHSPFVEKTALVYEKLRIFLS